MLFGRDADVASILAKPASVTFIVADSGVGKSAVLRECGERLRQGGLIAPRPVVVGHSPGSLQKAILEALGSALAEISVDEGGMRRVGELLKNAAARVVEARLSDMTKAVGRGLLDLVRARVGDTVADLVGQFANELVTSQDEQLDNRIRTASDSDVVETLATLAGEVGDFASSGIVLSLDNVERLKADDLGRLADLVNLLPSNVRLLGTFESSNAEHATTVDTQAAAGVALQRIEGVSKAAVAEWLLAAGLPTTHSAEILQVTHGYALDVADAIELIKAGRPLAELIGNAQRRAAIEPATHIAWRKLSPQARASALKLTPYEDPLSSERAAAYLGMDAEAWSVIRYELLEAQIFVNPNAAWFHQLRRSVLVADMLDGPGRIAAQSAAVAEISSHISNSPLSDTAELLVAMSRILRHVEEPGTDPFVIAVGAADETELAVLGALIELTEETSPGLNAEAVLFHARDTFGASGDLAGALARLVERELAVVASNESASIVIARFGSSLAYQYAAGRIADRLSRLPLPHLASLLLNSTIRPLLGNFEAMSYGIGEPSLLSLAVDSVQMQVHPPNSESARIGRKGPSILFRMTHGGIWSYGFATYTDDAERDRALAAISNFEQDVLGKPARVEQALPQPSTAVASRRLIQIFERALGVRIGGVMSTRSARLEIAATSIEEELKSRQLAISLITELATNEERQILRLDSSERGYIYSVDERGVETFRATVRGRNSITKVGPLSVRIFSPMSRYEISRQAGLGPGESLEHITYSGHASMPTKIAHPVVDEVVTIATTLEQFNQRQTRAIIRLHEGQLEDAMQRHLDETLEYANLVIRTLGLPTAFPNYDVYVLLDLRKQSPRYMTGAMVDGSKYLVPTDSQPRVRLRILRPGDEGPESDEEQFPLDYRASGAATLEVVFGVSDAVPTSGTTFDVISAVADALGFAESEIRLAL